MSPTIPKAKPGKKTSKTGEALKKEARKEIAQRIATLDAEARGEAPAAPEAMPDAKPDAKAKKPKGTKAPKPAKPPREKKPKRVGGLDAAAQVLKGAGTPMTSKAIMDVIREKKLWTTTGKTPEATIYAAIIREVAAKGSAARFKKVERGQFAFNAQ